MPRSEIEKEMEESQTSDEDEGRRSSIGQNDAVPGRYSPRQHRSSLRIHDGDAMRRSFKLGLNKWYLLAFSIPVCFLIFYFTGDVNNMFSSGVSYVEYDSSVNHMRQAELSALYLLRKQHLGLLKLFNHTFVSSNCSSNNSSIDVYNNFSLLTPSSVSSVQLDNLLGQISLNKKIQEMLLSSHASADLVNLSDSNNFMGRNTGERNTCGKVDQRFSERRTIEWKPRPNKYLFAICTSGQMSNHLICLEKHMFFAAVLNRVLVVPSARVDYAFHRVLDIEHVNECLGRKVVVTFEEFKKNRKKHLHIDKFLCFFSLPVPCCMDNAHAKKLKSLGISMSELEAAWIEDVKNPTNRTMQDVELKFLSDDDVIAIGDVFFADVEKELVMQPGGPIAHKCKTLIEPSRLIMLTAQRFIQTFLGDNFIALHFRRHGFLKFCNVKKPSCFYPVPQAAECINRVVELANAPVIYLSTDAARSETDVLQSLVLVNGRTVPLVKRPPRNSAEKWDALLYRHGLEGDNQVEAMLDKTICALSSVFIGSSGSTFTEDILRLRKDWGSASQCDEYLCQGELPNFVADSKI